jgi:hypothetical protein
MYILTKINTSEFKTFRSFFVKKVNDFEGIKTTLIPTEAKLFEEKEEAIMFKNRYLKGHDYKATLQIQEIKRLNNGNNITI